MSPQRLVLIGGGEHARVVAEAIRSEPDLHDLLGFVDPQPCATMVGLGVPRLGADDDVPGGAFAVLGVGAVGPSSRRAELVTRLASRVAGWAVVVHHTAWVSPTAELGAGTVVMAGAIVQTGARTGAHVVVNTGAIVEHDVVLGDHAQVGPGATLGGGATVADGAYVGLGARVRDHVRIGARALVGMGAVVVTDVDDDAIVVGVPARPRSR